MLRKTGDVHDHLKCVNINNNIPSLKVHNESLLVMIDGVCVNLCAELSNQFRTIVSISIFIVIYKSKPISLSTTILKNCAITMNICKNSSKVLFSEYGGSHGEKFVEEGEVDMQTSPENRGGKIQGWTAPKI